MRHLEDKKLCPHCGGKLYEHPYLMSRNATENVLSWNAIAWMLVAVLVVVVLSSL